MGDPGTGGVRGDAEEVDAAGGVLHHEQHIEPVQQQGVDAEEVGGEDAVGLDADKQAQAQPADVATRRDSSTSCQDILGTWVHEVAAFI